jgi:predicted HAD superfamily phosphohydrolase
MNKKDKENRLVSNAETELQKTQQVAESEFVKTQLQKFINKKLRKDIIIRDDLLKDDIEPDKVLIKNIEGRQEMLDSLVAEVNSNQIELLGSLDVAKLAIEELRKVNPRKASELSNILALKVQSSHSDTIKKKRL